MQDARTALMEGAEMPASVVTFCNLKGGVGKTSTTFHLGGTLAREGRRVLLIDADPQASLTQGFLGPDVVRALDARETIAGLFGDGLTPGLTELSRPTGFPGLDIVPGSPRLARYNVPESGLASRESQAALSDLIYEARRGFDYILIDSPPTLSLCSWAALAASDHLVVPLQAEDFGSQGIASILDFVDAVQAGPNPDLNLAGYLLTMFNPRLAIHKAYESMLRQLYGPGVFATTIPIGTDFKEAVAVRKPIVSHKPRGASAKAIKSLADELAIRLACPVQDAPADDSREAA
jgi:chromosome partitioning protein